MIPARPCSRFLAPVVVLVALAAAPRGSAAQSLVLDEGTFTLYIGGQEAGTESFQIHRDGAGDDATLVANAVVSIEGAHPSQMRPALKTAGDRSLLLYQNEIEGGDVSFLSVDARGRHLVSRVTSSAGERERELRSPPGAVLLDRQVAYQYWFLGPSSERQGTVIPVLIPRTGETVRMEVTTVAAEALEVGGQSVRTRHVRLAAGSDTRDVWFDEQGRVLQVEVPSQDYRAVRQAL